MNKFIKKIREPISDVIFPVVCACCGESVIDRDQSICLACLKTRFEPASFDNDAILPEAVSFKLSLWSFDKYGYLQNLLHKLKYDHCTSVGSQLGREAGRMLNSKGVIKKPEDWRLLAVPLHRKRYRKRGYNQSMEIANGVAHSTGIKLLSEGTVTRVKHTKTQTGLNSIERTNNISDAFKIKHLSHISDAKVLIVDDVFTTGATTFELAQTIKTVSGYSGGILTIAQA